MKNRNSKKPSNEKQTKVGKAAVRKPLKLKTRIVAGDWGTRLAGNHNLTVR